MLLFSKNLGLSVLLAGSLSMPCQQDRESAAATAAEQSDSTGIVSRQLDSLGVLVQRQEEEAFALASQRFFQAPEDADPARPGFYQSSVKILRLAVDADSTNAEAVYHLGAVLARKSYAGFGKWDTRLLREAVARLRAAKRLAMGRFAYLRPAVDQDLSRETHNLSGR